MPRKRWLWWSLPQLIVIAAIGAFIYAMVRRDTERARLQHEAHLARTLPR